MKIFVIRIKGKTLIKNDQYIPFKMDFFIEHINEVNAINVAITAYKINTITSKIKSIKVISKTILEKIIST